MQDYDLLMLENLTYLEDSGVSSITFHSVGGYVPLENCNTIGEFLDQFGENELEQLDNAFVEIEEGDKCRLEPDTDKQEWAARIRYMKENEDIRSLKSYNCKNGDNYCLKFEDPNDANHCIVAFQGTNGTDEWVDNIEGLNRSDTERQISAKNYIDGLDYDKVTVVGHSKGGNKAMYVAVTCDKVDKCVSYDGQGFSQEFIDKYSIEIQNNAHKITNYSLKNDYVHILMFPVPGATQIYMEPGNRVNKPGGAHYPIGPFTVKEKDGKYYIDTKNGVIKKSKTEEPEMTMLHNFTTFFMNNASKQEREKVVVFLTGLMPLIFPGEGKSMDINQIAEYLRTHREGAIKIVAYLLKYIKDNGLGVDEFIQIACSIMGITDGQLMLFSILAKLFGIPVDNIKDIIKFVIDQVTDGKEDLIIQFLIGKFGGDYASEISSWWRGIENEYNNIKVTAGSENYKVAIRNYSIDNYNRIMSVIANFENNSFPNVSAWSQYSGESWYTKLLIASVIKCINGYKNKLSSINSECRTRVNSTFNNIEKVDSRYGKKIDTIVSDARTLRFQILN